MIGTTRRRIGDWRGAAAAGVAALALAGCGAGFGLSTQGPPSHTPDRVGAARFSDDGANAKLAAGPEADPAALLECEHGGAAVHVTDAVAGGAPSALTLASGHARSEVSAERQDFEGRTLALADARIDDPALAAFRRSGRLELAYAGRSVEIAADRTTVARFFTACEGRT